MKLKNIMINIKVKILEKALEKIIKNKLNKLVDELEVKVKILQNGGIIEHKSDAGPKPDPRLISYAGLGMPKRRKNE